ncbi:MAG: flavin reductase [Oscillospiraceae bacterium]|nr:flavin reductase [Oscillospiraceae bacterium]
MNLKALFKLSYGVFILSSKSGDKINACITNTCMQVANDPVRIAISVLNTSLTCDYIKSSGVFSLSILDKTCIFDTVKHFGMQSGREVNKFEGVKIPLDLNGVPYLPWSTCAVLSAKVIESIDMGTHTLFIAETQDMKVLSDEEPLTYDDYHKHLKPKPQAVEESRKIIGWKCKICGFVFEGETLPEDYICPLCGHGADDFEPIYE